MSHCKRIGVVLISVFFLGLDFPKFKTGEERALKNFQVALSHYNAREYGQAREKLLSVLTDKKDFPLARLYLSRALYQSGDWLGSLQELEEILQNTKKDPILTNRKEILSLEISQKQIPIQETVYYQTLLGSANRGYRFRNPVDAKSDEDGNLYILSFGTTNLIGMNPSFEPLWSAQGGFARKMKGPIAMEYANGLFYVCDFPSDSIFVFNRKGSFQRKWGETGSDLGKFRGPSGITRDSKGFFYVSDLGNHRIQKFSPNMDPMFAFGTTGKGRLESPTGILWNDGLVHVLDKDRNAILIYDEEGNYRSVIQPPFLKKPRSLAYFNNQLVLADEEAGLYFYNPKNEKWDRLPSFQDSQGRLRNIDRPFSATRDEYGYIYITDYNRNRVDVFAPKNYLLTNLNLEIEKIDTTSYPHIHVFFYLKNRRGQDILSLDRKDFNLRENGNDKKLFDLTDLKKFNSQTTVSLVYENSAEFLSVQKNYQAWMEPFFNQFTKNDRIELLRAGETVTKMIPYSVSHKNIFHSIRKTQPEEVTQASKAIYQAIGNLSQEMGPRAVVYLASGKYPLQSQQVSLRRIIQYARANGIQVYPILARAPEAEDDTWETIAQETGGEMLVLEKSWEDSTSLYGKIQAKKDNRYVLSYQSEVDPTLKGRWVPLEIDTHYREFGGKTQGGYFVP